MTGFGHGLFFFAFLSDPTVGMKRTWEFISWEAPQGFEEHRDEESDNSWTQTSHGITDPGASAIPTVLSENYSGNPVLDEMNLQDMTTTQDASGSSSYVSPDLLGPVNLSPFSFLVEGDSGDEFSLDLEGPKPEELVSGIANMITDEMVEYLVCFPLLPAPPLEGILNAIEGIEQSELVQETIRGNQRIQTWITAASAAAASVINSGGSYGPIVDHLNLVKRFISFFELNEWDFFDSELARALVPPRGGAALDVDREMERLCDRMEVLEVRERVQCSMRFCMNQSLEEFRISILQSIDTFADKVNGRVLDSNGRGKEFVRRIEKLGPVVSRLSRLRILKAFGYKPTGSLLTKMHRPIRHSVLTILLSESDSFETRVQQLASYSSVELKSADAIEVVFYDNPLMGKVHYIQQMITGFTDPRNDLEYAREFGRVVGMAKAEKFPVPAEILRRPIQRGLLREILIGIYQIIPFPSIASI